VCACGRRRREEGKDGEVLGVSSSDASGTMLQQHDSGLARHGLTSPFFPLLQSDTVIIRTRKFMANPLMSRKQMVNEKRPKQKERERGEKKKEREEKERETMKRPRGLLLLSL
jgi:hypothetical protein